MFSIHPPPLFLDPAEIRFSPLSLFSSAYHLPTSPDTIFPHFMPHFVRAVFTSFISSLALYSPLTLYCTSRRYFSHCLVCHWVPLLPSGSTLVTPSPPPPRRRPVQQVPPLSPRCGCFSGMSGCPSTLLPDWSHPLPLFQELDDFPNPIHS